MDNKFLIKNFILFFILLFCILAILICNFNTITNGDIFIIKSLQSFFSFISVNVLDKISLLYHDYAHVLLFFIILFLVYKKNYGLSILFLLCDYTRKDIITFLKNIITRHRPPFDLQPLHHPDDFSFPSGHSYSIMMFLGLVIYIIFKYIHNKTLKYILTSICVLIIFSVGLSRILLGVHYPTDVLAGYLLGLIIVSVIIFIDKS